MKIRTICYSEKAKYFLSIKEKVNDTLLKELVQNSLFLTDTLRQEILQYFEQLSQGQKASVYQAMMAEKPLLLRFLKDLKSKPELRASQIQEQYKKYKNKVKKQTEFIQELEKQKELESLFLELEETY